MLGKKYDFESVAADEKTLANQWFGIQTLLGSLLNENCSKNQETLLRITKTILALYRDTVQLFNQKKSEKGYLDYEDLQIKTRELLKNPDVRTKLAQKFKYLMIDEYQDTNLLQYEIFCLCYPNLKAEICSLWETRNNLFTVSAMPTLKYLSKQKAIFQIPYPLHRMINNILRTSSWLKVSVC